MTIAILKLLPGQTIARPFNRAHDAAEAIELICRDLAALEAESQGMGAYKGIRYVEANWERFDVEVDMGGAMDTETPVAELDGLVSYFAFREC